MSEGKRPGGLTALAVLNFVFGGMAVLSLLGMLAFFALMDKIPTGNTEDPKQAQVSALKEMGTSMLVINCALMAASAVLLLLSGIGYLKQKKVLGRILGNLYAVAAIGGAAVTALVFKPELGGGFHLGTMIGLIYPVLTLILLNTTFRDDLVN